jgi:elongation factor Ts
MIKITTTQIKKLREQTKAGIMDCRKALEESSGDVDKAKKWLLKKGALVAAKKANRETKAGLVEAYVHADGRVGSLVKLTCETDFVARTQDFKKLAHEIAMQVAAMKPKNVKELMDQEYIRDSSKKIKDLLHEAIGKIGENIKIEEFFRIEV